MDRVDGFYLYISDDEWITVNNPTDTIYVDHYEIISKGVQNEGTEYEFEYAGGNDFTQIRNKDGSGKWSEVRNRHYSRDTMPLE